MQSYVTGSRLSQTILANRTRCGRCRAADVTSLPSLQELNSVALRGTTSAVSDAVTSSASSSANDSVDAITSAANSIVVDAASSIPSEYLALGAVGVVAVLAIGALSAARKGDSDGSSTERMARQAPPRKNAVLVFGASGRTGKQVVKALLDSGRTVVGTCRKSVDKKAWAELGIKEGKQENGSGVLFLEGGITVTDASTLKKDLFKGVTQAVIACGAVSRPDGKGFEDGLSPQEVDAEGVANVVKAAAQCLPKPQRINTPIMQSSDFESWEVKDDAIMGGSSSSTMTVAEGSDVAEWAGELVVEGGGFCGVVSGQQDMDFSAYDGVTLRVKGNGETFKFNLKTADQVDEPVQAYQATFDTVEGDWLRVSIAWHEFVPVKMAKWNPEAAPLNPANIVSMGLVYSRFDLNGIANPNYSPGPFTLLIEGGMSAFTAPCPTVALVTSAATERNAVIGDDAAARAADIPIVQLNPAGTLNWKYKGETALRESGLAYSIVRPTGLIGDTDPDEGKAYSLEFSQGDSIAGRLSRPDVAGVITALLREPAAVGATFEVRRTERWAVGGPAAFDDHAAKVEFLKLVKDTDRRKVGLRPMPSWVPPPEPVPEQRKQDILADPRVQEVVKRGKLVSDEATAVEEEAQQEATATAVEEEAQQEATATAVEEQAQQEATATAVEEQAQQQATATAVEEQAQQEVTAGANSGAVSIALRKAAVKQWVADYRDRSESEGACDAEAPMISQPKQSDIDANKAAVQKWVASWRERIPEAPPAPPGPSPEEVAADIAARKEEVQGWVSAWRVREPEPAVAEAVPMMAADVADDIEQCKADVQAWISSWRAQPASTNGASSSNGAASPKEEAKKWIAQWRAKSSAIEK